VLAGQLRIGALQTAGHTLPFASWLAEFALAHPRVQISVVQLAASEMVQLVLDGGLDCGLVALLGHEPAGLDVVPLLAEPLVLACLTDHPLADESEVRLEQLVDERFVESPPGWSGPRSTGRSPQRACGGGSPAR
jgi:DNA-binding transcriptional LysR family regulator